MAVAVRGHALVLDGRDCLHLAGALSRYIAEQARRDGGVPPRLREIAENVVVTARAYQAEVLAGSDCGTEPFRDDAFSAPCAPSATSWLTVEQTAHLLGCSHEYVRRLLRQRELHGSRAGGRGAWSVDAASVVERLGERRMEAA
ncbi:helix-turn-helix domain-containing protein [Streptomyces sp. NPDC088353]|uniref:helix-turn-helix domain-containing protein n=1 Tax=Streptomyces sp. NPDC088353 TaxID=3365855 RepID=UPI0037F24201